MRNLSNQNRDSVFLPKDFSLSKYGINVRLVDENDANFILSLRTNEKLSKYIHKTDDNVEKQREWIKEYKRRESDGSDYYFIFIKDEEPFGVCRIYDIDRDKSKATVGSWVCKPDIDSSLPILSIIITRDVLFEILNLSFDCFDVKFDNKKVRRFHESCGAVQECVEGDTVFYKLDKKSYIKSRNELLQFLDYGNQ